MPGARFESARLEMALDQVARTPSPRDTCAGTLSELAWLVKGRSPESIIASLASWRNPQSWGCKFVLESWMVSLRPARHDLDSDGQAYYYAR